MRVGVEFLCGATRHIFGEARVASREVPVRVVVLTTFALDDKAAEAIRHGASGFLLKTCTPAQLHDAVRTVHAGNAVLAPDELVRLLDAASPPRRPEPPALRLLTDKEREVLDAVARGMSNAEIGAAIFAGESTIKTHVGAILRELGLRDRV